MAKTLDQVSSALKKFDVSALTGAAESVSKLNASVDKASEKGKSRSRRKTTVAKADQDASTAAKRLKDQVSAAQSTEGFDAIRAKLEQLQGALQETERKTKETFANISDAIWNGDWDKNLPAYQKLFDSIKEMSGFDDQKIYKMLERLNQLGEADKDNPSDLKIRNMFEGIDQALNEGDLRALESFMKRYDQTVQRIRQAAANQKED
ncbi:MAG: hypothetical protein Q4E13_12325 [Clostridia bacterium]|nr:hypothetical protein [Clostridia bacterium]